MAKKLDKYDFSAAAQQGKPVLKKTKGSTEKEPPHIEQLDKPVEISAVLQNSYAENDTSFDILLTTIQDTEGGQTEESKREIFRIELYRQSADTLVKGKVIHALSKEEVLLNSLNDSALNTFMAKFFPLSPINSIGDVPNTAVNKYVKIVRITQPSVANIPKKLEGAKVNDNEMRRVIPNSAPQIAPETVELSVFTEGGLTPYIIQDKGFNIQLFSTLLPENQHFHTIITANNLESREKFVIIDKPLYFENGRNCIKITPNLLKIGTWRFKSIVVFY